MAPSLPGGASAIAPGQRMGSVAAAVARLAIAQVALEASLFGQVGGQLGEAELQPVGHVAIIDHGPSVLVHREIFDASAWPCHGRIGVVGSPLCGVFAHGLGTIGSTCLRVPRLGRTMPAAIQASTSRNSSSTSRDCSTLRSTRPWA